MLFFGQFCTVTTSFMGSLLILQPWEYHQQRGIFMLQVSLLSSFSSTHNLQTAFLNWLYDDIYHIQSVIIIIIIYLFIKDLDNQLVFVSSLCSVILLYITRDLLFHWTELLWNSGCSSECQSRWNQEGFSCGNVFFGHLVSIFWASLMAWKRIFWVMVFSFLFLFCFCNFHIASLHVKNFVICCDWAIFWVSYSLHYFQETFVFGYISAIKNFIAALKVS